MKKLIAFTLLFFTLFTTVQAMGYEDLSLLSDIGVVPPAVTAENYDELLTKEEFAFMAAHLIDDTNFAPCNTGFADVDETNEYSGYIEFLRTYGVINGTDGSFNPKDNITMPMACKMVVFILGYDNAAIANGGYPDGYINVAQNLKLLKNVALNNNFLTKGGAVTLAYNALYTEISGETLVVAQNSSSYINTKNDKILLNDRLGISVYMGTVTDVKQNSHSIEIEIEKNKYNTNPEIYNKGSKTLFKAKGTININAYLDAPVTVWVNKDEEIVHIAYQTGYSVKCAVIDSVNNDDSRDASYKISKIDTIMVADDEDEYDVSKDAKLKFNDKFTENPVRLAGKFARMVCHEDEIVQIEAWDLSECGLIENITENAIVYTKLGLKGNKLADYNKYNNTRVFIDGREASITEIKPDSTFSYYKNNDKIVYVVSEKVIMDTLIGIGNNRIEIGDFNCLLNDYYVEDSELYRKNSGLDSLLGAVVKAHLSFDGYVTYIKPVGERIISASSFYGVVKYLGKESPLDNEDTIVIFQIYPEIKTENYKINNKTVFENGLNIQTIQSNLNKASNEGVYKFETNGAGKVTKIAVPKNFDGFEDKATVNVTQFSNSAKPLIYIDSRPIYFTDAPIIAIYSDENSELKADRIKWQDISGNTKCNVNVTFYGEKFESIPTLVLLHGANLKDLGGKDVTRWGIASADDTKLELDENGETYKMICIRQNNSMPTYKVSEAVANTLFEGCNNVLVSFYTDMPFSQNDIRVLSKINLTNNINEWQVVMPEYTKADGTPIQADVAIKNAVKKAGLHKGIVRKIDNLRVYVDEYNEDVAQFIHSTRNFFVEASVVSGELKFKNITIDDISVGDEIYYNLASDGVKGIILVR